MKKEHPRTVPSRSYTRLTHRGRISVNVCWNDGAPLAVFGNIYKADPCLKSELEAVGRLCSLAFRLGGTIQDVIKQLEDIKCEPVCGDGVQINSVADAIAKVLIEAEKDGQPTAHGGSNA